MRTIETKLYKFEELNTEAQEAAREKFNEGNIDFPWQEENLESMKKGLEFYGFKLKDYSFDYYCATSGNFQIKSTHYEDEVEELSGARLYKYLLNNFSTYRCQYTKEQKETLSGNCPFTGYCVDENFLDPIREFMKLPTEITFMELMEESVHAVAKAIENDYEHSQTMEYFKDHAEANELEFTKEGEQY